MDIKIIETELGKIEYSTTGNGKPLLFIHGGHTNCNSTLWQKGFDIKKFQFISPSRPGYGNTPLNNNKTPKQQADLIISLLDYMSIDKVILYGISAGGLTTIEFASNYPERVEKLILASCVSKEWLDKKGKIYKTAQRIFNPKVEGFVWRMIRFFSGIFPNLIAKNFYPQFTSKPTHKLIKEDVNELISMFKDFGSGKGFVNDIDQIIDQDLISKIKCPTLIIHSKNDNSVLFEHALHSNKMIDNSKLVELNNEWGHLFWIGKDSNDSIRKTIEFSTE
ncbi:MAG: alpha/beta hydrolase [Prolixibacteraceae bacterium]|jgi:pimeloyl-ACP methyl ester carboxylesterase|nr:alpha/beta hydrolase [Prolixibacteraceae bacterium]MBT6005586.1 alpha/beta hydrolase [Prolixibacteraceae bacterium]MBT6766277.1 alpha/beta hydrolase [Prolixibacteraceae bacterium]MBT6998015.1 alpha/beta hydrolase [Prolixibacteraceae bacterium]MBT7394731.1 alpha/beta hydrolase [Prolixibacteraceae bacterium]